MSTLSANRRGILALVCSCAAFSSNDAITKIVVRSYPAGEIMFVRGLVTTVCILAALVVFRQTSTLPEAIRPMVLTRALFDAAASAFFITALAHVGIAELSTMVLASPLLITIMAVALYREPVGWRRWSAITVGLIGVLFVVKPDPGALNVWALLGLCAALGAAARDITTRQIHHTISTLAISVLSCVALTASGLMIGLNESWRMLAPGDFILVVAAAVLYGIATYLLVIAFRGTTISVVSPFRYTLLIWAGIAGYTIFGEIPDRWSLFGAALIVGTGIYTLHREAVRHRYLSAKLTTEH